MRARPRAPRPARARRGACASIARAAHDLRDRLISLEANPLLVARAVAVAVDALAEAGAARDLRPLAAALGWGARGLHRAVAGRRKSAASGSCSWRKAFSAAFVTAFALATRAGAWRRRARARLGGRSTRSFSATAYVTHYKALELGPLAVVSPVGPSYALVGVVLAIVVLGERPNASASSSAGS